MSNTRNEIGRNKRICGKNIYIDLVLENFYIQDKIQSVALSFKDTGLEIMLREKYRRLIMLIK